MFGGYGCDDGRRSDNENCRGAARIERLLVKLSDETVVGGALGIVVDEVMQGWRGLQREEPHPEREHHARRGAPLS